LATKFQVKNQNRLEQKLPRALTNNPLFCCFWFVFAMLCKPTSNQLVFCFFFSAGYFQTFNPKKGFQPKKRLLDIFL